MTESVNPTDLPVLVRRVAEALATAEPEITTLDASCGDGDLGLTVRKGMQALQEGLAGLADLPPHQQLAKLGTMFNSAAASTFGALVATAAMRAARAAQNAGDEWDLMALAAMARAAEQGVSERGKAVRGQKTMLDALGPAVDALGEASKRGATLAEAAQEAARAAEEGAEATSALRAQIGRAGWLQERTVGVRDPGAYVVAVAARAVARAISG